MILKLHEKEISDTFLYIMGTHKAKLILNNLDLLESTQVRASITSNISSNKINEVCIAFTYYDYPFNLYLYKGDRFTATLFYASKTVTITDLADLRAVFEHIKETAENSFITIQNLLLSNQVN
jgi:hypothetical protein